LSVFYHWNLYLKQYTETLSIFYISDLYIRLVVILQFASLIIDKDNFYWTWSPVFNSNTSNQYLLLFWTLSTHLKLQLYNRQIVQHISQSQDCSDKSILLSLLHRFSILYTSLSQSYKLSPPSINLTYYLSLSIRVKGKPYIRLTQENLMKF